MSSLELDFDDRNIFIRRCLWFPMPFGTCLGLVCVVLDLIRAVDYAHVTKITLGTMETTTHVSTARTKFMIMSDDCNMELRKFRRVFAAVLKNRERA